MREREIEVEGRERREREKKRTREKKKKKKKTKRKFVIGLLQILSAILMRKLPTQFYVASVKP